MMRSGGRAHAAHRGLKLSAPWRPRHREQPREVAVQLGG